MPRANPPISSIDKPKLFNSSSYSDFTVRCQGKRYKCHRMILDTCPFFEAAMKTSFKEGQERIIDLSDDDPDAVKAALQKLYDIDYTIPKGRHPATFHAEVAAVGHMYDIPELLNLAKQNFRASIKGPEGMQDAIKAADVVYNKTPNTDYSLRQYIIQSIEKYGSKATLGQDHETRALLRSCPDLAVDILMCRGRATERAEKNTVGKYRYACRSCGTTFQTDVKGPVKGTIGKSGSAAGGGIELRNASPGVEPVQNAPGWMNQYQYAAKQQARIGGFQGVRRGGVAPPWMGPPVPGGPAGPGMPNIASLAECGNASPAETGEKSTPRIWCPGCGLRYSSKTFAERWTALYEQS